jgi:L-asparaginase/Glu-tRNA(Gln) amidotransferase subunit D
VDRGVVLTHGLGQMVKMASFFELHVDLRMPIP